MRKVIFAAAAAGALLSGCSAEAPFSAVKLPEFGGEISATATINYGKETAEAEVTRTEAGSWEFSFTAPEELAGVVMTIDGDSGSAALGDITVDEFDGDYTPLPMIIAGAIDGLEEIAAEEFSEKDGILTVRSDYEEMSCTVTADRATGEILSVKSPSNKLAVYFTQNQPHNSSSTASTS